MFKKTVMQVNIVCQILIREIEPTHITKANKHSNLHEDQWAVAQETLCSIECKESGMWLNN